MCAAARAAVILALGVLLWPGAAAAQEPADSPDLRQQFDRLLEETRQRPADLDILYELANVAMALGDLESAISALERLLIFNPDLPRVRLELGVLYFRLGSYAFAKVQLERAVAGADVPPEVQARVDEYLAAIERQQARNVLTGEITLGGRYQTNPAAISGDDEVRLGDLVFRTTEEEEADKSTFASATLTHLFRLRTQWDDAIVSRAQLYGELFADQSDLDVGVVELDSGPQISLGRYGLETATVRPFLSTGYVSLDHDFFYRWAGGGLDLAGAASPRLQMRARLRSRYLDYQDTDSAPYGDRTGWRHELSLGGTFILSSRSFLDAAAYAELAQADQDYRAYWETGLIMTAGYRIDLPEGMPIGPVTTYLGGSLAVADYDSADPLIEPDTVRHDKSYAGRAGFVLDLRANLALLGEVEHRRVVSNVNVYEYDNTSFVMALRLRF